MRAPRVLVVGSVLSQPMGGVRRHAEQMLPRAAAMLRESGGRLAVLAGRDGVACELGDAVEVLEGRAPSSVVGRAAFESRAIARALEQARERRAPFDVVHTGHLPLPRGVGAPITLVVHDLKTAFSRSEPLVRRVAGRCVIRDALRRASRVVAVSRTLRGELLEHFDVAESHVVAALNGADHLPLHRRAPRADAPLLFVGHLEPRKNVASLLRGLALERELGELWLAGAGRPEHRAELEQLARELGVLERVKFLGLQDDDALARLYATCRCVVLPSTREGFDIPLVEALRAGAPIVCSNLAVHRELAGDAARFLDPAQPLTARLVRDAEQLARAEDRARPPLPTWRDCARAFVEAWSAALDEL